MDPSPIYTHLTHLTHIPVPWIAWVWVTRFEERSTGSFTFDVFVDMQEVTTVAHGCTWPSHGMAP